jgi:hypothetical protein
VELIRRERFGGLSIDRMCTVVGISRPAFYRWQERSSDDDMAVRSAMHDIALEFPCYGYRPMTQALRRALGIDLNFIGVTWVDGVVYLASFGGGVIASSDLSSC